ncbi:hypothetical protein [Rhizobium sp. FKL33]|uniref:hypothetical protein n=1 Tax=Rhizobium sp. FKL33 TaxID=2562307 RepID=UPI0010C088F3|nr:hypothetical protein [Rhizobium sp. FKL33]
MTIFDPLLDLFRGKAVTVPPLDGAFRPNRRLDEADSVATIAAPVDLAIHDGQLLAAAGNALHAVSPNGETRVFAAYQGPISALAVSSSGSIAVALETGAILLDGNEIAAAKDIRCVAALSFTASGELLVANGSARHRPSDWRRDLMEKGATGSVWRVKPNGESTKLIDGLGWPSGVLEDGADIVVSEAWTRRVIRISASGATKALMSNIPGYPGRLSRIEGGALLSIFAPVNRLIEFVLQEDQYRQAMMEEIAPEFWIAPSLASGRSFLEPLQCGGIKTMGIHKPWSPSRSYGLVARLDQHFQPIASYHSRADGKRHGIVAALSLNGRIHAASAGGDEILALAL